MMREYHLQTPQKANRQPKAISDHAKKNQKIVKKSLNSALSSVSEDSLVFQSPNDLIGFSLIPDISEHILRDQLPENSTATLSDEASFGSESAASSVLTPLSSTITIDDHEQSLSSINPPTNTKSEDTNLNCFEAELAVKYLWEAQRQLFNARTIDMQCKRILDALINVIVKEFYEMPQDEEEEGYNEVTQRRTYLAFISILLLVLVISVVIIFFSSSRHTFTGPTPT